MKDELSKELESLNTIELKRRIFNKVINTLEELLCNASLASNTEIDVSADAPGKNEARYDSTREEMSYVYNAFAKKATELEALIMELNKFSLPRESQEVELGSLVELQIGDIRQLLFIIPCAGGYKISSQLGAVMTISQQAPVFKAIIGKKIGDEIVLAGKTAIITSIK